MYSLRSILIAIAAFLLMMASNSIAQADLVTISVGDPVGRSDVSTTSAYVGIVDQVAPLEIGGQAVRFNNLPAGEAFQVGDLIGRDMNGNAGDRQWEYLLSLPGDALAGTGFQNISFAGHAFERTNNNLENSDELTWELFLNGSTTSVDSATTGAGVDFNAIDINLSNSGGAAINEIRVVFSVVSFNGTGEAFATRGLLSADYNAVPEPNALLALLALAGLSLGRQVPR